MTRNEFDNLDSKDKLAIMGELSMAANMKCAAWEESTFYLGSPFSHCEKLMSFADSLLRELGNDNLVNILMESEYHAPRFVINK